MVVEHLTDKEIDCSRLIATQMALFFKLIVQVLVGLGKTVVVITGSFMCPVVV